MYVSIALMVYWSKPTLFSPFPLPHMNRKKHNSMYCIVILTVYQWVNITKTVKLIISFMIIHSVPFKKMQNHSS